MRRCETMKILRNNAVKISLIVLSLVCSLAAQITPDNKTLLANFDKSIENGKLSEIERELFNYLIANPKDAAGFSLLAKLRLKQNRPNEAKALANKALVLDPILLSAKFTLVQASIDLGEMEASRQILNGISEKDLSDNYMRLKLAQNFVLISDCPKALSLAEKLPLKIKDSEALPLRAACYLKSGDKKNLVSLIPLAKPLAGQNPIAAMNFAEVLTTAGMFKESVDLLRLTILAAPKNVSVLLLLAKSEIFLKDFANAKIHLAAAEKVEPISETLFFTKSLLESEQGNDQAAFDLLEKSLTINSNNLQALSQFVRVALRVNQKGKAVRAGEKLLSLEPENLDFLYLYGIATLQNNNLQKAETSLTRYFESRPGDSRGCLALGLTFAAQAEKLDIARQQLQKCLQLDPNNFEAAYQLGLSYKTLGDSAKALEYFEQTVRLSSNYENALRDLGTAYLQTGAEAKARPVLEKAVLLDPNDADAHFQLSRLYNVIGERELAKKHLELFQKLKNPKKEEM
jgi:tetratricopeptide (TPR) repeat protein